MADAELHIVIKQAGDPEKLGALLNAAISLQERPMKTVVPSGYRCEECWQNDGGHGATCSMRIAELRESRHDRGSVEPAERVGS